MKISVYLMDISGFGWEQPESRTKIRRLTESLSESRQKKIRSLRGEKGRRLSLGAGLLLDRGLREYGLREREVRIGYGPYGKPFLADYPDIHFSLSHSGTMVMAAFAPVCAGCDVEKIAQANSKIAERFFAPEEAAALRECRDEAAYMDLFYRIWTRKESYIKMTGEGMHLPLDSFFVWPDSGGAYVFREFPVSGYKAALCVAGGPESKKADVFFSSFQNLQDVI